MTVNPPLTRNKLRRKRTALHAACLPLILICAPALAQTCPDSGSTGTERPAPVTTHVDFSKLPVQFNFAEGSSVLNGESHLVGAQVSQGERSLSADALHYDFATKIIKADGNVTYEDAQLRVSGSDADMDSQAGVQFNQARFAMKNRAGRGSADHIQLTSSGNLHLDDVRYTTCPANKPDWELKLSDLDINQTSRTGTGRNVRLEFKDIPIFYTPWISFPVGDERKSGFLFPNFRSSSRGGYSLLIPWYWNIAPNYDATFTPIIDSARGVELNTEFRYLSELSKGTILADYLPHDPVQLNTGSNGSSDGNIVRTWRGLFQVKHQTDFKPNLRLQLDASTVSDNHWFEDFGQSRDETSQVYLPQVLNVSAYSDDWVGNFTVQNLQILDDKTVNSDPDTRPYTIAPQISVSGHERQLPFGFDFDFDGELSYFTRDNRLASNAAGYDPNITGARLYAAPTLSLPLRAAGMYVIPRTSWRYTAYHLNPNQAYQAQHPESTLDRSPTLSAPVSNLDMGMTFERLSVGDQRLYTLQPRVLYSYIPYRTQATLPVFDTGLPDFNLVQLFRVDRFIGNDRVGDANQISTGVTTRMLDGHSGRQFLSGTLGQAFYLRSPCVTTVSSDVCDSRTSTHSSQMVGQVALSAYRNWTASLGIQWDPTRARTERSEVNFQYLPGHDRVVNLSYRYARGNPAINSAAAVNSVLAGNNQVDQWETSFAWPIGMSWSTYGRVVYSNLDKELHDYLGGLEYRSCCWNLRLVYGRSITTRQGTYDTRASLQFEFKGLGSAGTADAFLQSVIPGYSARRQ